MRSKLLIMSTAALLAGTLAAASQSIQPGGQEKEKGSSSQGVNPKDGARGQATKGAQAQPSRGEASQGQAQRGDQDKLKGQTQGQVQRDQDKAKSSTQGQAERDQDNAKGKTQGQVERDQDKAKSQTQGQAQGQAPRNQDKTTQGQNQRTQGQNQNQNQRDQDRVQQGEREKSGGTGGTTVSFTSEQRTKIRETVFKERNAPRVSKVNFAINVGTVVPRTVHIIEVPEVIVDIHPEWRGFRYFIVNEEIVIVEPDTLRIVAVIAV
jgi:DNA mismatch repair ATPase MutL